MKKLIILLLISMGLLPAFAQQKKISVGIVDVKTAHPIGNLDNYMKRRTAITTTIIATVMTVKNAGKTFTIKDASGKIIPVHFAEVGLTVPANIKGKKVMLDGVISKQFAADDHQHYAGKNTGKETNVHQKTNTQYAIAANGVQAVD